MDRAPSENSHQNIGQAERRFIGDQGPHPIEGWFILNNDKTPLTLFQVLGSVLASFFGVQRDETRRRDFERGRARDFIFVGVLLTGGFVLLVWGVVQLVMYLAIPN